MLLPWKLGDSAALHSLAGLVNLLSRFPYHRLQLANLFVMLGWLAAQTTHRRPKFVKAAECNPCQWFTRSTAVIYCSNAKRPQLNGQLTTI
jgi:hypothetical protein